MKRTGTCPKCGAAEVLADVRAIDRGDVNAEFEFSLACYGRPEALIFKQKRVSKVSAWVCGRCGFVEFYADSPSHLARQG